MLSPCFSLSLSLFSPSLLSPQCSCLSAVTGNSCVCYLAKVHLQFEEHPKIMVASNCITCRRLMAPVRMAGPSSGCVEDKCILQVIHHVANWNLLLTK